MIILHNQRGIRDSSLATANRAYFFLGLEEKVREPPREVGPVVIRRTMARSGDDGRRTRKDGETTVVETAILTRPVVVATNHGPQKAMTAAVDVKQRGQSEPEKVNSMQVRIVRT